MAAVRRAGIILVSFRQPRSLLAHRKLLFKFRVDRVGSFEDIVFRRFSKFGLTWLFTAKECGYGDFDPLTLSIII